MITATQTLVILAMYAASGVCASLAVVHHATGNHRCAVAMWFSIAMVMIGGVSVMVVM